MMIIGLSPIGGINAGSREWLTLGNQGRLSRGGDNRATFLKESGNLPDRIEEAMNHSLWKQSVC